MFTNRCNGKSYIGQSVDIERRYREHRFRKENTIFHSDLDYYGFHNFDFRVLEECRVSDLNDREIFYIKEYRTLTPHGYNATQGGTLPHVNALNSLDDVYKIIEHLRESVLTNGQIGSIFGITDQMVSDINCGRCWRQDDITYPIRNGRKYAKPKRVTTCCVCGVVISNKSKTHMCRKCYKQQLPHKEINKNTKNVERKSKSDNKCKKVRRATPITCVSCGKRLSDKTKTGMCRACYTESRRSRIPPKAELEELLYNNPLEVVARMYGVKGNSLRKWCDALGISRYSKDYRKKSI